MTWTEHRTDRLKALWKSGATASVIADDIGMSKNAVIGKAHRLGLSKRPSPIRRKPIPDEYDGKQCNWPIGDPQNPDFRFCEGRRVAGRPYCSFHCKKAYRRAGQENADE